MKKKLPESSRKMGSTGEFELYVRYAERLNIRMGVIYGHLWTSRCKTEESLRLAIHEWASALQQAQLNTQQIGETIEACRNSVENPPSIALFLRMARKEKLIPAHLPYMPLPKKALTPKQREVQKKKASHALNELLGILDAPK